MVAGILPLKAAGHGKTLNWLRIVLQSLASLKSGTSPEPEKLVNPEILQYSFSWLVCCATCAAGGTEPAARECRIHSFASRGLPGPAQSEAGPGLFAGFICTGKPARLGLPVNFILS